MPVILIVPPPFVSIVAPGSRIKVAVPENSSAGSSRSTCPP